MRVYGLFIGLLATLMGVGGGLFANLVMTFYGRPIHQGVATSSALAVLVSIPGALGYVYAGWPVAAHYPDVLALQSPFAIGYVSLIGAVLAMPTSLLTAPLGVRVAHAMSKTRWSAPMAATSLSPAPGLRSACCNRSGTGSRSSKLL